MLRPVRQDAGTLGAALTHIRIAMMDVRPRLRDMVFDAVTNESDIEVVTTELKSLQDLRPLDVNVVIIGAPEPADAGRAVQVMMAAPRTRVLMIAPTAETAVMYELHPCATAYGEISASSLVHAIRTHAAEDATWPISR